MMTMTGTEEAPDEEPACLSLSAKMAVKWQQKEW